MLVAPGRNGRMVRHRRPSAGLFRRLRAVALPLGRETNMPDAKGQDDRPGDWGDLSPAELLAYIGQLRLASESHRAMTRIIESLGNEFTPLSAAPALPSSGA